LALGALLAGLAVGIGAFGAHALKPMLQASGLAETFETAVRYHFYHALGLLLLGLAQSRWPEAKRLGKAALLMATGIGVFSGSLYLLCLSGMRWLGAVTPLGGLAFMAAWALAAWEFRQMGQKGNG
jgi:uncharacterized membrane protein YgdD (TMEM256/DUF423 family)